MVGLENSRHSLYQSDATLKQITNLSPAFSRAFGSLFVFYFEFSLVLKSISFLLVAIVIALDTQLEGTLSKAIQWKLKENSTNFREGRKRVVKARVNFGLLAIAVKLATIDMEYSMYIKKKFLNPFFTGVRN